MNKSLLVLRHEIATVIRSKSFLITSFALPLVGVVIFLVVSLVKADEPALIGDSGGVSGAPELQVEGYVDQGGLIAEIPADVPEGILVAYPDRDSAHQALNQGEIAAYYVIPADYLETGDLTYINPDYRPLTSDEQSWVMRRTVFANLLDNDPERIARARQPMDLELRPLVETGPERDEDNPLTFYIPYATMMMFYFVIIMSASLLLNSVSNEKKNQTIEVLLLSVSPRQMLTGKIVGLGLLGLLQMVIWVGTGYGLLRVAGRTFELPAGFELPPSFLAWGLVFFLLGYAIYASLMAGLGALVPNLREASQAVIVVIWPLIIPMFLMFALIEDTHGVLATTLSLFPLTAPIAMITRLVIGGVPWWQLPLAVLLLAGTAALIVRAISGMFHAQTLLSGQPFSVRRFVAAFLGRG